MSEIAEKKVGECGTNELLKEVYDRQDSLERGFIVAYYGENSEGRPGTAMCGHDRDILALLKFLEIYALANLSMFADPESQDEKPDSA